MLVSSPLREGLGVCLCVLLNIYFCLKKFSKTSVEFGFVKINRANGGFLYTPAPLVEGPAGRRVLKASIGKAIVNCHADPPVGGFGIKGGVLSGKQ